MNTIADEVANLSTRLNHLELKSEADDKLIRLLKQQNEEQAIELTALKHKHDQEVQQLRHGRDVATRKATEVTGIIETLGTLALNGINKMRADETPEEQGEIKSIARRIEVQTMRGHSMAEIADRSSRHAPMRPMEEDRLPRPVFIDQPNDPRRDRVTIK